MAERACGFAALVGAPNAGKSTLMNRLIGMKLSIVSPKVQTTRTRVRGVAIEGDTQIVFVDTPGIFEPKRRLDRAMVHAAWTGAGDADEVVLLVDAARSKIDADTLRIIEGLKKNGQKAILAMNKVDLVKTEVLLPRVAELNELFEFTETFMISAETGNGCGDLVDYLAKQMPEGPWLYPEDEISDLPMRLLAAEFTREQVFRRLHQELPYQITVETESWEDQPDGSAKVNQVIYVQRKGHKGIVLGQGGKQIKGIGAAARRELENVLERKVHLFLFVKVRENWGEDPDRYSEWGLEFDV